MGQLRQLFISKWIKRVGRLGRDDYFKVRQEFISKCGSYYKVGQKLFQSGTVVSIWDKLLFQSQTFVSEWSNYFKVGNNTLFMTKWQQSL